MNKKVLLGVGVAVVVILALILVFSMGGSSDSSSSSSKSNSGVSSEEQKFAEFQAELTCELVSAGSAGDIAAVMAKTASVMAKYGYDDAKYKELEAKYTDDDFKKLIVSEMEKQCPESVDKINQ